MAQKKSIINLFLRRDCYFIKGEIVALYLAFISNGLPMEVVHYLKFNF